MKLSLILLCCILFLNASAQNKPVDSVNKLNEVVVKGYYQPQSILRATSSVNKIDSNQIRYQPGTSLVSLLNTVAGVRMEERSPGSYRLSFRGSLLRSPFGIRNVKIYLADFPLTDAGGNTYLNLLDPAAIGSMEIYKGPEASIFGANTGGTLLISAPLVESDRLQLQVNTGSYGLFHQQAKIEKIFKYYRFSIVQGYQKSNGYRDNSAMNRKFFQTTQYIDYNPKGRLNALLFYSDLHYQTPGALTQAEMLQNPKAARPASGAFGGAVSQQAGIDNRTFFGGLSNTYQFSPHLKHVIALFTSYTDFKNPFITNFEKRKEATVGLRSFMAYANTSPTISYDFQAGIETASTTTDFKNYGNDRGTATALKQADDLRAHQDFAFLRLNVDLYKKLTIELSSSLNAYGYTYRSNHPIVVAEKRRTFPMQFMPKLAATYLIGPSLVYSLSVSKGYAPPTLSEVRASDNVINTDLEAEAGWNYETGLRYLNKNKRFTLNATLFYFNLRQAIVRRLNANDVEYFVNAGGTKQLGTEVQLSWWLLKTDPNQLLNGILWTDSYTYSHFRFQNYQNAQQNYSGKRLTGVPGHSLTNSLTFNLKKDFYLFVQHQYVSTIPLNDGNTVFAKKYHLLDLKTGSNNLHFGKTTFNLSFGINNILNQQYSLGNDLNVANNRYFNPAALSNFYVGLAVKL